MRLALKITWVVMALTAVGLGVQAKLRLDRELELIDFEMRRDQRLLGRALLPVLDTAYQRGGATSVEQSIAAAYASEREIELEIVPIASLRTGLIEQLARSGEAVATSDDPGAPRLTTYLSTAAGGVEPSALKLSESLKSAQDFTRTAVRDFFLLLAWLMVGTTAIGTVAGYWLVGRRVEKLIRAAQAVSSGSYSASIGETGWDEIAILSREMSKMASQLEKAAAGTRKEAERRGRLLQRLRHADRLATVGTLASRVAHDVGTPLNVISARAKMIARGEVQGDEARENAQIVADQSDRIAERIRNVLGFARGKTGANTEVDLAGLVGETQTLLASLARAHGARLIVDLGYSGRVPGVELQLQQALVNLTVNAIHVAPTNSEVVISTDRAVLKTPPAHVAPGPFVKISITDEGVGVPEHIRKKIFEPFFTTKASGEGTGLGLPIAAEIVRDHGGFIHIEDRQPTGSAFTVFIPEGGTGA